MVKVFDEFNSKFKFIFGCNSDKEVAEKLQMRQTTFATMKKRDEVPYELVIKYCEDKQVKLDWILNLKTKQK
ncbi:helix-turn-helix domain-containing protein [Aliarcobacter butzleri]|uniref:helix-turn-helix domain-containing protein n=1 Tax=Aliarcobacter butzleri TaxID=28197 RepID=UPI0015870FB6|nr:helix-turn-helix domain-containing protein [Aliarcobacter butzleri]MCT7643860.1 helix-turn-helix domain containing protein [Aliarcobacter butzleri]NUW28977.1 helix-turn-helix domain-containing protein [Aliarcobacter butzleri]